MAALKATLAGMKKGAGNAPAAPGASEKQASPTTGGGEDKKAKWGDMRKKTATSAVLGKYDEPFHSLVDCSILVTSGPYADFSTGEANLKKIPIFRPKLGV